MACVAPWPPWAAGGWPWTPKPASWKKQITALIVRARTRGCSPATASVAVTAAQLLVTAGGNPRTAARGRRPGRPVRRQPGRGFLGQDQPATGSTAAATGRPTTRCGSSPTSAPISDPRTRAFVAKRTATGNSRKEIMRMLQRYIARELYPLIIDALRPELSVGLT